jgi:hypothetical protein
MRFANEAAAHAGEAGDWAAKATAHAAALAGPRAAVRHYLTVERFRAAQRDAEDAAHVAKVQAVIQDAARDSAAAYAQAAEAAAAAAHARDAAEEAEGYAQEARRSADQARGYAEQAAASAQQAQQSAAQAAASAQTAKNAAAAAEQDAARTQKSANAAASSAHRASASAQQAQRSAEAARNSALEAGLDSAEASRLALEALNLSIAKQKAEDEERRRAGQSGSDGLPQCTLAHKLHGIKCAGGELLDALAGKENWCTIQWGHGAHCDTIMQLQNDITARENEQGKVVLQLVLAVCGFIPVVGEPCDALDALIAYLEGDETGAGLSLLAMVPLAGWLFGGARGADLLRQLNKFKKICKNAPGLRLAAKKDACAGAAAAWVQKADFSDVDTLRKKYDAHADDFGVVGNQNNTNLAIFIEVMKEHMTAPGTKIYRFNYRGQGMAVGFIDPNTRLMVMLDASTGKFWSGWQLFPNQFQDIIEKGYMK